MIDSSFEIDIDALLLEKVLLKGGTIEDFNSVVGVIEALAARKNLDVCGLLMVAVDCIGGGFSTEDAITQLKVNCGEFGI